MTNARKSTKTPSITEKPITGSKVLCDTLLDEGVDTVFGYPGGVVLPIFDELYDSPINFIIPRHEQGGTHMADGYARASGKVGVVLVTSGPGACNTVTGIATAFMDSIPMVIITGQVKTHLIGNDAFQEADTTGITKPITKHNYIVKDPKDLGRTIREAFHLARTGRPGPVLIDLPVDVTTALCQMAPKGEFLLPGYKVRTEGHMRQIVKAAEAINAAQRPVIYSGGGVLISEASAELTELVEKSNVPITTTLLGLGAFDENKDLSLEMLGMHGTAYANFAIQECDLLVAIGSRFDDRITGDVKRFAPNAKIIHIDIDPSSISKNVKVDIPVVGDAKKILVELNKLIEFRERKEWLARIAELKEKFPLTYDNEGEGIKPQYVIEEIWRQTKGQALVTTGVGQHQMWAAQFYKFSKPRHFISSGGLGTMGFGVPACMGAQIACPDATVINIDGDSSFSMSLLEIPTAVEHNLPVKICVLNNGYMGMVRQWQELFYGHRYSKSYMKQPCFAKVAEAFGAVGITVSKKSEVADAVKRMLAEDKCCVVDFQVEREENVWPMVATGKGLHEMAGLPTNTSERV
ncbi:MAG: biosynthetic-type acetolactate synthase large subunit [Phycisphaerae bacterium]|nr:biosynthetic-type acetolactate synthase large subunit [Phycisphaerae bacterium]